MDLAGLELTHIWSKGPMHLALQGVSLPCVHRNQGPITEELSVSFVGYPTQVSVLVYAQFTWVYGGPTG
jgi:hypothetical protein